MTSRYLKPIPLTEEQRQQLLSFLDAPLLLNTIHRVQFLEDAGLKKLIPYLHFDAPQHTFVRNLLDTCITFGIDIETGTPYLTKLLRHLKETVWVGQPTPRAFVEHLLGTTPASAAQTRLAQGILEAVQAVCSWWP